MARSVGESPADVWSSFARFAQVPVARRFKTVVTSAAGYPLDTDLLPNGKGDGGPYRHPGAWAAISSSRPSAPEGMGSSEYVDAQRRLLDLGMDGFFRDISRKTHADIDEWQTQMQLKPMRLGGIHLYSTGLRGADRTLTGCAHGRSRSPDAVAHCVEIAGDDHVAVIPEGPYVVPVYQPA